MLSKDKGLLQRSTNCPKIYSHLQILGRARSEPGGTRWRTGGEVKGKLANGVDSQYSHATSERGLSSITQADAHTSAASSRLNWHPHRFKWTRPFRGKTKSGFCACAITFRTSYTRMVTWSKCHTVGPTILEWPVNLTVIWPFLFGARELIRIFVCNEQWLQKLSLKY